MLIDASKSRHLLVQTVRIFLICLAVVVGISVILIGYLGLRYGWNNVVNAATSEDAKNWVRAIILIPSFGVLAYLLDRFFGGLFRGRSGTDDKT